jgi:hypothetical protein
MCGARPPDNESPSSRRQLHAARSTTLPWHSPSSLGCKSSRDREEDFGDHTLAEPKGTTDSERREREGKRERLTTSKGTKLLNFRNFKKLVSSSKEFNDSRKAGEMRGSLGSRKFARDRSEDLLDFGAIAFGAKWAYSDT